MLDGIQNLHSLPLCLFMIVTFYHRFRNGEQVSDRVEFHFEMNNDDH